MDDRIASLWGGRSSDAGPEKLWMRSDLLRNNFAIYSEKQLGISGVAKKIDQGYQKAI